MAQLASVSDREFMKRLFEGERDFSRKKFVGDPISAEQLKEINRYLESEDHAGRLKESPIIIDGSDISGLALPQVYSSGRKLIGIHAPYTKARGIVAVRANFSGSYLEYSDFGPLVHPNRTQTRSNLSYAIFNEANMQNSVLRGARVAGTRFMFTNLWGADIQDISGAQTARYLDMAIMSPEQRSYLSSLAEKHA